MYHRLLQLREPGLTAPRDTSRTKLHEDLSPEGDRNSAYGALLLLLAESSLSAQTQIGLTPPYPSPSINHSPPGRGRVFIWSGRSAPAEGPLSCSDSTSKRILLSSSDKQQVISCGVWDRSVAGPEGTEGI